MQKLEVRWAPRLLGVSVVGCETVFSRLAWRVACARRWTNSTNSSRRFADNHDADYHIWD